jgi:serine/threonine protein kinase, bacterial
LLNNSLKCADTLVHKFYNLAIHELVIMIYWQIMHDPLLPGSLLFNRYCIAGLAGQGQFGLTYLAQDQKRFEERCIVKEFAPPDHNADLLEMRRQSFHQSAAVLYELQHPQVPRFNILFAQANRLYLVRDYIVGKSYGALLTDRQAEGQRFSQAEVMQLMLRSLPVFTYLHRSGLIHQNISPHSLILRHHDQLPVLIDFGLVKQLVIQLHLHPLPSDVVIGDGYEAPEFHNGGKPSPSADLYSLAATAIALLTGREPQELYNRRIRTLDWDTEVDLQPDFARILKQMLHANPQKRYGSAVQVSRALEPIATAIIHASQSFPATIAADSPPRRSIQSPLQSWRMPTSPQFLAPTSSDLPFAPSAPPSFRAVDPPQSLRSPNPHRKKPNGKRSLGDLRASALLVGGVVVLAIAVSFRTLNWVQTQPLPQKTSATNASTTVPKEAADPTQPTREAVSPANASVDSLKERQKQLGIDFQFVSNLTDELFYTQHPDLKGRPINIANQPELQNEWASMGTDLLSKLESLSPEVRGKLGTYQRSDYDKWLAPGNGASLNARELNVLVNKRFGDLFPDQKGKTLSPKTFGQVWYAIAQEELKKLKP